MENKRRYLLKKTEIGASLVAIGGILPGFSTKSCGNIIGTKSYKVCHLNNKLIIEVSGSRKLVSESKNHLISL